jgi:DNA-binding transcriptional ArsR family regulator
VEDQILKILEKSSFSLTIDEVSKKIGITRQTTSKYLFYLEGKGLVKRRDVGTAKLYYLGNGKK